MSDYLDELCKLEAIENIEKKLAELFKDKDCLHGNDYEKWDMRKPSVNFMLWSLRNIFKKGHYAY